MRIRENQLDDPAQVRAVHFTGYSLARDEGFHDSRGG
jgi:hypothetical protein